MRLDEIYFELPESFIAQTPAIPRDHCKLMVIDRASKAITHHQFKDLPDILPTKTLFVRNTSKVIPARLQGTFPTGGAWEIFFLKEFPDGTTECFVRPGKKFTVGAIHSLKTHSGAECVVEVIAQKQDTRILKWTLSGHTSIKDFFKQEATIPLPPYIHTDPETYKDEYQTIYAQEEGSVAAPTAGLHFTAELEKKLQEQGHSFADLTLHVGAGTFQPIKTEDTSAHQMHSEDFFVTKETLETLRHAKGTGTSILTVGTTSSRTVEHLWQQGLVHNTEDIMGETSIYIHPPYTFQGVDMMITNFHLPKSTLLLMVASFIGDLAFTLEAYETAKEHNYRFYSFGDAMLIL